MKKTVFPLIFAFCINFIYGQEANQSYFKNGLNNYELSFASSGTNQLFDLGWNHLHGITKNKKFRIGYGIRFTGINGSGDFYTAPANLTKEDANLDTINGGSYSIGSLNLSIHLNYQFNKKWEAEFNIDAVGFSFGSSSSIEYNSTKRLTTNPLAESKQNAAPTPFNILLVGDNDIGNLNSQIKIKYRFHPQWAFNFGGTYIFSELTTNNKLYKDNDRFRQKNFMPMIGISYSPFKNNL
jgi:long-subunit fatty acid transport protein